MDAQGEGMNLIKHHVSFTEEYDSFKKDLLKKIDVEPGISHEKKIIGLRKINSKDFQYIENQDFSADRLNPETLELSGENMEENAKLQEGN